MRRAGLALALVAVLGSCGIGGGSGGERLARALGLPEDVVSICGDPRLLGKDLDPVGRSGGCGISEPVAVYAVGEVRLSRPARLNCTAAQALRGWADGVAAETARAAGARVSELRVAADYACRRRNNRPSGPLSEHAKGNAIDVSAVTFSNGDTATVLSDWNRGPYSKALQGMHKGACGPFGVVLGPRADRHHRDHFHFDVSNKRRPYCR